jgi:hypothetical protein
MVSPLRRLLLAVVALFSLLAILAPEALAADAGKTLDCEGLAKEIETLRRDIPAMNEPYLFVQSGMIQDYILYLNYVKQCDEGLSETLLATRRDILKRMLELKAERERKEGPPPGSLTVSTKDELARAIATIRNDCKDLEDGLDPTAHIILEKELYTAYYTDHTDGRRRVILLPVAYVAAVTKTDQPCAGREDTAVVALTCNPNAGPCLTTGQVVEEFHRGGVDSFMHRTDGMATGIGFCLPRERGAVCQQAWITLMRQPRE